MVAAPPEARANQRHIIERRKIDHKMRDGVGGSRRGLWVVATGGCYGCLLWLVAMGGCYGWRKQAREQRRKIMSTAIVPEREVGHRGPEKPAKLEVAHQDRKRRKRLDGPRAIELQAPIRDR